MPKRIGVVLSGGGLFAGGLVGTTNPRISRGVSATTVNILHVAVPNFSASQGIGLDLERPDFYRGFRPSPLYSVDELIGGVPMKSAIANLILPDEHFVVQVDGQAKSEHRRFVDALIASLLLRNEFPQHEVKLRETQVADVIH